LICANIIYSIIIRICRTYLHTFICWIISKEWR